MTDERILAFRDALADGDDGAAAERFSAFGDALSAQAARARALQTLARAVVARTADGEAQAAAQRYLKAAHDAGQARIRVEGEFFLYTQDGPSAGSVADTVDELVAASEDLRDAEAALREAAADEDVDLPAQVAVLGTDDLAVAAGEAVEATYTVANVGTVALADVSAAADSDGLAPSVDPATVGSLAPGEEAAVSLAAPTDAQGEFEVTVRVDGDGASDDLTVAVAVLGAGDYLETALAAVREAADRVERLRDGADGDTGGLAGLLDTLRTVEDRLETIEARLESGGRPGTALANRIGSAINTLGAVLNQADALEGGALTGRQSSLVGYDVGAAIDDLATARDLVGGDGPGGGTSGGGKGGSSGGGGSGGKA